MSSQSIVFTALPAGVGPAGLRLTLFMTPNLEPDADARLSAFPAFARWPETARKLKFRAHLRRVDRSDLGDVALTPVAPPIGGIEAWRRAFPADLAVGSSPTELAAHAVPRVPATYDITSVRNAIRELYATEVAGPADRENAQDTRRVERRNSLFEAIRRYDRDELEKGSSSATVSVMSLGDPAAIAFRRFQAFHLPPEPGITTFSVEQTEFHELVAAAGQHPLLLRLFGLAIDFDIAIGAIPTGDNEIAIVPGGDSALFAGLPTSVVTPWTRFRHDEIGGARRFTSLGRDGTPAGYLLLQNPKYETAVEDVDGGGYGAIDYVERQQAAHGSEVPHTFQDALPALRTKGVQIFNTKGAEEIRAAQERAKELADLAKTAATPFPPPASAAASAPTLFREDVTRGHRAEARAHGGPWRSLCSRHSRTTLTPSPIEFADEGFLSESMTDANSAATGSGTRTSQVVVRWNGWNLVVPRPGAVSGEGGVPTREGAASTAFALVSRVPAGSLPRLRYGTDYQIRCPEVDLSGNGPARDAPDSAATIINVRYVRHDPVPPPRLPVQDNEKTAHLIFADCGRGLPKSAAVDLFPPIASLDLADKHGVFDATTAEASYRLLRRTGGSAQGGEKGQIVDPAFRGIAATRIWPPDDPTVHVAESSAVLLDIDADSIAVQASAGSYDLRPSGSGLRIKVPPAGAMRVKVASFIPEATRGLFELHGAAAVLGSRVYDLIAPPTELIALHPVERPLAPPTFGSSPDPSVPVVAVAPRKPGDTHAVFQADGFAVEAESTGRFDIFGEWDEVSDAPDGEHWPSRVRQRVRLFGGEAALPDGHPLATHGALKRLRRAIALGSTEISPLLPPGTARYDFRDTKYRHVALTAVGVSRFQDLFPASTGDPPDRFQVLSAPSAAEVPNTRPPEPPQLDYVVPTIARSEGEGRREARQQMTEGWGLRVYLTPGDWFESGDGVRLAVLFSQPEAQGALSQIAGDPILEAAAVVNDLTPSDFVGARSEHANLKQAVSKSGDPVAPAGGAGLAFDYVSAATFDVGWDAEKELIYADLVLRPRHAYRPFVRLALARFQPTSVDGAYLSTTVLADFMQLSPERTLSIVRASDGVRLRLVGAFPRQSGPSSMRTQVVAVAERSSGHGRDKVWSETGRIDFALQYASPDLETFTWTATVPHSLVRGGQHRIIVEEWETWPIAGTAPISKRLAYSDAVEL